MCARVARLCWGLEVRLQRRCGGKLCITVFILADALLVVCQCWRVCWRAGVLPGQSIALGSRSAEGGISAIQLVGAVPERPGPELQASPCRRNSVAGPCWPWPR